MPPSPTLHRCSTPAFNVQPTFCQRISTLQASSLEPKVNQKWEDTLPRIPILHRTVFAALFLSRDRKKQGNCDGACSILLPFRFGNSITWVYDFRRGKQAGTCRCDGWRGCLLRKTQNASNRRHRCVFFWSSCAASCRGLLLLEASTGRRTTKDLSA